MIRWLSNIILPTESTEDQRAIDELVYFIEGTSKNESKKIIPKKTPPQKKEINPSKHSTKTLVSKNLATDTHKNLVEPLQHASPGLIFDEEDSSWTKVSSKKLSQHKKSTNKTSARFYPIQENMKTLDAQNSIKILQILASENLNWNHVPTQDRAEILLIIDANKKPLNTWQLFVLIWSCARLDINFFTVFHEPNKLLDLLDNEKNLLQQFQTNTKGIAGVIWGLTVFLYKYSTNEIQRKQIKTLIQNRINKITSLAEYDDVHRLRLVRHLLHTEALEWPSELFHFTGKMQSKETHSPAESKIYVQLNNCYPSAKFTMNHKNNKLVDDHGLVLHDVDIISKKYNIAVEVDGKSHYYADSNEITTRTWLRNQLIQKMGYTLVCISLHDWEALPTKEERKLFLEKKIAPYVKQPVDKITLFSNIAVSNEKQGQPTEKIAS